jgi:hypothetical protein
LNVSIAFANRTGWKIEKALDPGTLSRMKYSDDARMQRFLGPML